MLLPPKVILRGERLMEEGPRSALSGGGQPRKSLRVRRNPKRRSGLDETLSRGADLEGNVQPEQGCYPGRKWGTLDTYEMSTEWL